MSSSNSNNAPKPHQSIEAATKMAADPAELTQFVDTVLNQLQGRFETMSAQILGKMEEMTTRMDDLESSIGELMQQTQQDAAEANVVSAPQHGPKDD